MSESDASECHSADAEAHTLDVGGGSRDADADLTMTSINPFSACASPAGASPSTLSLDETPPPANCASEQARVSETVVVNTSEISVNAGPVPPDRENEHGSHETPSRYKLAENAPRADDAVEISFVEPGNVFVDLSAERNADATLSVDQLPNTIVIDCDLLLEAAYQRATPTVQSDKLSFDERPPCSKNGDTAPDGAHKVSLEQRQGSVTQEVRPTNGSVRLSHWKSFRNSLGADSLSVQSSIINDTESYILTLGRKASAWVSNETYVHDSQQQYNHHHQQQQQQQRVTASVTPAKKANPHKERFFRFGKTVLWVLFAILLVALSPLIMIGYGIYAFINCIACPKERSNDTVT
ncbi:uncharacterized protein LOC133342995 [Lethenteron reissneri]|uniref:uncharacterized protein LOC133342995 n=1 Tax=Lethenteron reissneri TaxID=7753 RepID=UPI002AB5FB4F|nr:uncharacterized protein LOC133342995 [Lethenteron reissneri]XP_061408398.1 uncharacterized protein LOC133342995 [Lethenteron reissneri]